MSLEVKYIDAPPGAQEEMVVAATCTNVKSELQSISEGRQGAPWATMEPFGWPLDGTREIIPDDPSFGFWSDKPSSGSTGILGTACLGDFALGQRVPTAQFEIPPVITLQFTDKYSAAGITFVFSPSTNEWCSEMLVKWYSDEILLAETNALPSTPRWTLLRPVEGFNKVQIEILGTNKGGHYAKIEKIEIGQTFVFGKDELTAARLVNEIDPTLSDLTVDTMTIEIQDKHDRNLSPQENQRMELYRNKDLLAVQYITACSRQSRQGYSFTCQSAVGLLEDTFLGGMYVNAPVDSVVQEILEGRAYDIGDFTEETVTGYLPVCTRREALQQLAIAVGAVLTTQGTAAICLTKLPSENSEGFKKNSIFVGGKVETTPRIYKIEAVAHSYAASEETETLVENEEFDGDDILLTFDEPHHTYVISGGEITASGVNFVKINASGAVTISAKKYTHNTVRHSRYNSAATVAERNNIQTIEDATLIHNGNVKAVLDRIYQFANLRQTLTQEVVVADQHAGQKIVTEDPWGGQVTGYITAMESELTQSGHTASITVIGVRSQSQDAYGYSGQLFAGNTEVVY